MELAIAARDHLRSEGYFVARGLLDPDLDIRPLERAYSRLIDDLLAEYGQDLPAATLDEYVSSSFPERIAAGIGLSKGALLHHIDPVLSIFEPDFRWRRDLPDPRIPELLELIRNPRLVDAVQEHIGPRITASPVLHVNIKLAIAHIRLARWLAWSPRDPDTVNAFQGVNLAKTHWHMDAIAGLKDSHSSRIVNTWVPMTSATERNGCLRVVPRSHMGGVRYPPYPRDLDARSVDLKVEPGDVVFLDNLVMHCSTANISKSDYRWAFNFRYVATGAPSGRPFLPEFVVRDPAVPENELRDPQLWSRMWRGCLDYHARHGFPITFEDIGTLSLAQSENLSRFWTQRAPDPESWMNLGEEAVSSADSP